MFSQLSVTPKCLTTGALAPSTPLEQDCPQARGGRSFAVMLEGARVEGYKLTNTLVGAQPVHPPGPHAGRKVTVTA